MSTPKMIKDEQEFNQIAANFFTILFAGSQRNNCSETEIRGFEKWPKNQSYHNNVTAAVKSSYKACQQSLDVYVGVNPRVGQAGKGKKYDTVS